MAEHLLDRHDNLASRGLALHRTGFHAYPDTTDGTVLIRLEGELDMASAPRLGRILHEALDGGAATVALDLTGLTFLDSTGIRVLFSAHRRAAAQGCAFILRSPTRSVLKVLRLTGVERLMVIEPALLPADPRPDLPGPWPRTDGGPG